MQVCRAPPCGAAKPATSHPFRHGFAAPPPLGHQGEALVRCKRGVAVETCNSGRGKPLPYVTTKGARFAACQTFCRICLLFCANGQAEIGAFLLTTGAGVCYNPDNLSDTPREVLREGALRYAEPPQQQLHDGHDDVHLHGDVQPLACAESGMSFVVPGRGLNRTKERLLGWKRRRFQPFLICGGNCFD